MATVFITGAAQGFGRALVEVFIKNGWTAYALVRREADAHDLQSIFGDNFRPIVSDIRANGLEDAITSALSADHAAIDVLINSAGNIVKDRGVENIDPSDLLDHYNIHCVGAFRVVKAALPWLRTAHKAKIINISSRWASISGTIDGPKALIYAYQMAKCGQNMLSACFDLEFRDEGIRAFSIHPGRLKTKVAAPDADTEPEAAAAKLFDWINRTDESTPFAFYDLMNDAVLPW